MVLVGLFLQPQFYRTDIVLRLNSITLFPHRNYLNVATFVVNDNDCDGGYPVTSFKYATLYGIVTGSEYKDDKYCKSYGFPPCDHGYDGKFGNCGQEHF